MTCSRAWGIRFDFWAGRPHAELPNLIAEADFTVLMRPNKRYTNAGFPTKLVESLASGVPVIANLTSDIGWAVRDGREGLKVDDYSAASLAATLSRAAALEPDRRAAMRAAAEARVREVFDFRRYAKLLGDLVESYASESERTPMTQLARSLRLLGCLFDVGRRVWRRLRMLALRPLFESHGRDFTFDPDGLYSFRNVSVGDDVSLGYRPVLMAALSKIRIGSHVMFGPEGDRRRRRSRCEGGRAVHDNRGREVGNRRPWCRHRKRRVDRGARDSAQGRHDWPGCHRRRGGRGSQRACHPTP